MSELAERYRRRANAFEAKVAAVAPEQWANQSPCEKWSARDVLDHIVSMHGVMLRPVNEALPKSPTVAETRWVLSGPHERVSRLCSMILSWPAPTATPRPAE
jgi:hypothetical protein